MAEQTKFWYLKNINVFEGMSDDEMSKVEKMTSMSNVSPNQPIAFPDELSRNIYLLKRGHVKISRVDEEGREMILEIVGPGEMFGELALLDDDDSAQTSDIVQALDDVLICAIRRELFEQLMRDSPELTFKVTKRIGLRLRRFEKRITDLMFKDVRRRLIAFLLNYAEDFGKIRSGIVNIPMHLSHQEIALLTGAARQTVTTILNELRERKLIDFSRTGMTLYDMDALRRLAAGKLQEEKV
ncbi:MAG: Crp/Fnr family transcriptional regulator [Bacteroidetes bacterium]|nr:Crp/Fnr family transcriptional regulator [Bacteroidota bacterium]